MPTLLITGANRGLGLALVRVYARAGWRVHACCRRPEHARALRAVPGDVHLHRLDVRDTSAHRVLADRLAQEPVDLLIANAGIAGSEDRPEALDVPGWLETFHVDTIAPVVLAGAFRRHVARSRRRLMVAISSRLGSITDNRSGGHLAYRCAKAALNMAWRSLAIALADDGIVCVLLHPGWVRTDMGGPAAPMSAEASARALARVIDRLGPADSGRFLDWRGEPCPF